MEEISMSLKIHNYNYAPGISTYGLPGKDGVAGKDGNNIYFTTYDININESWKQFVEKLRRNMLPIKSSDIVVSRPYKDSDYFFDFTGRLYTITNIEKILANDVEPSVDECMQMVGQIRIDDTEYFSMTDNRMVLNENYKGFDIIDGLESSSIENFINKDATMNIVSSKIDKNNNINLMQFLSLYNTLLNNDMIVYFDTTNNTFHISSEYPIVLDGNVTVKYRKSSTLLNKVSTIGSEYSKVILENTEPITKLRLILSDPNGKNNYKVSIFDPDGNYNSVYIKILFTKNYSYIKSILNSSYLRIYTDSYNWMHQLSKSELDDSTSTITIACNPVINDKQLVTAISFMHNIEIMLNF